MTQVLGVPTIFDYQDYKLFLLNLSDAKGARSGFKSALARACGCNNAYISTVLGGKANLSLEQAECVANFLQLLSDESHFFLLLVQRARAGTRSLRAYFDQQIDPLLKAKLNVQKRLGANEELSAKDQAQYYSSWMYAAIHVALSIPRLAKSPNELAKYFNLPPARVKTILEFLVRAGMAVFSSGSGSSSGRYAIGPRHIHLGKSSTVITRHHSNWRLCALRMIEDEGEQNLNYSSVVALSRRDADKVREILLSAVKKSVDLIMTSPEEEVFVLNVDFVTFEQIHVSNS
jgi:uncharacterized protein (TIGR02147 family)